MKRKVVREDFHTKYAWVQTYLREESTISIHAFCLKNKVNSFNSYTFFFTTSHHMYSNTILIDL